MHATAIRTLVLLYATLYITPLMCDAPPALPKEYYAKLDFIVGPSEKYTQEYYKSGKNGAVIYNRGNGVSTRVTAKNDK